MRAKSRSGSPLRGTSIATCMRATASAIVTRKASAPTIGLSPPAANATVTTRAATNGTLKRPRRQRLGISRICAARRSSSRRVMVSPVMSDGMEQIGLADALLHTIALTRHRDADGVADCVGRACGREAEQELANSRPDEAAPGEERDGDTDDEEPNASRGDASKQRPVAGNEEEGNDRCARASGKQKERRDRRGPRGAAEFFRVDPELFARQGVEGRAPVFHQRT